MSTSQGPPKSHDMVLAGQVTGAWLPGYRPPAQIQAVM